MDWYGFYVVLENQYFLGHKNAADTVNRYTIQIFEKYIEVTCSFYFSENMCKNLSREKYFQKFIHISALLLPLISLYTSSIVFLHGKNFIFVASSVNRALFFAS